MKLTKLMIILTMAGSMIFPAMAQTSSENKNNNVVEKIVEESEGTVEIEVPDNILREIMKDEQPRQVHKSQKSRMKPGINKVSGYRIQVFSDGSHQASLESRARARGSAIVAKFPKYRGQVYSYSSSPNWYTRIGNFMTSAEASAALSELKRAFPQFAAEMRVVKSSIVVIK